MKVIVLALLLCFAVSYKRERAVEYARKYCKKFNPDYYDYSKVKGDDANFVSQCLKAGGFDLSGCAGKDKRGSIPIISNLKSCLSSKGWKNTLGLNKHFKDGYPFFLGNTFAYISTAVIGNSIKFCAHDVSGICDSVTTEGLERFHFYYL